MYVFLGRPFLRVAALVWRRRRAQGFTLVETLLYVVLIGSILVTFSYFFASGLLSREKALTGQTVEQNTRFALARLTQEIRDAKVLNASTSYGLNIAAATNTGKGLSLGTIDSSASATEFYVNNGVLEVRRGTAAAVALTSSDVQVQLFQLTNRSSGTNRAVAVQMVIQASRPTSSVAYGASSSVQTTVNMRNR
jgi:Tfp pilus assembly protein PilW